MKCAVFFVLLTVAAAHELLALTQTVRGNRVSERRWLQFRQQMESFGIPYDRVFGYKAAAGRGRLVALGEDFIAMFERLQQSDARYGLICEDDTYFHPNFTTELPLTMQAAGSFNVLSVCNGNLWGRVTGPATPFGTLVFDDPITFNETDPTGRVYMRWPHFVSRVVYGSTIIWPGAPVCLVVRNEERVVNMLRSYIQRELGAPLDLIFRNVALRESGIKIVAYPQLCREFEHGKV